MERRWHPWRDLRGRRHVTLVFDEVADEAGGAVYGQRGDRAAIVLSPGLGRRARSAALAHELVHDERQVLAPEATEAQMEREEAIVAAEVARRLVPLDELEALAMRRAEVGPLMAWEVADHFDVPEHVAWDAVRQLQARLLERELRRAASPHHGQPVGVEPVEPRPAWRDDHVVYGGGQGSAAARERHHLPGGRRVG